MEKKVRTETVYNIFLQELLHKLLLKTQHRVIGKQALHIKIMKQMSIYQMVGQMILKMLMKLTNIVGFLLENTEIVSGVNILNQRFGLNG
jgi:hypothetical protein